MNKLVYKVKNMSVKDRIKLIIAIILTALFGIVPPTFAWLSNQRQLAELQSIRTPDLLYISAANAECVKYFDLSTLDVAKTYPNSETKMLSQIKPFCVAGEYVSSFTLQLAHTTNNPYTYKIYEGTAYTDLNTAQNAARSLMSEGDHIEDYLVVYTIQADWSGVNVEGLSQRANLSKGQPLYIVKGACLNKGENTKGYKGEYLNLSGDNRTADNTFHGLSYDKGNNQAYDQRTKYSEPLFWQCTDIKSTDDVGMRNKPFIKTFVFEVSWPNNAQNNKETDIIYLSAFRK